MTSTESKLEQEKGGGAGWACQEEIENQVVELQEAAAEKKQLVEKKSVAKTENLKFQLSKTR